MTLGRCVYINKYKSFDASIFAYKLLFVFTSKSSTLIESFTSWSMLAARVSYLSSIVATGVVADITTLQMLAVLLIHMYPCVRIFLLVTFLVN